GTGAVAGIPLALPSILIETVSAGGGSVAWVDEGGALKVGPESAGAVPGPACYGRGGDRPTVTDACLVLGWLDAASPLADELRLDPALAERAVASLGPAAGRARHAIAAGVVAVAAGSMARAVQAVRAAPGAAGPAAPPGCGARARKCRGRRWGPRRSAAPGGRATR